MTPVQYDPSLEQIGADEAKAQATLIDILRGIATKTKRDYGHGVRAVHAKSYALLDGTLTVLPGLPGTLAQGIFAQAATYPVVMRFSTNPGDILHDGVSAPRGLALKVIGVPGERLPGAEGATQDFVMVNAPAFAVAAVGDFVGNLKLLAATTDRGERAKRALSAGLRGVHAGLASVGLKSGLVDNLGGQPMTHPLGEHFFTSTPFRYGDLVAKIKVAPVSPNLVALTDQPLALDGPNTLRQAAIDTVAADGAVWEVQVQLCTDLKTMPIEDASAVWPEDQSPYVTVARIEVSAQPAWSDARAAQADDRLSFSPWHGVAAHRPLGSINRSRQPAYMRLAALRAEQNGVSIAEPASAVHLAHDPARAVAATPGREGLRNARPVPRGLVGAAAGAKGGAVAGALLSVLLLGKEKVLGRAAELTFVDRNLAHPGRPYTPMAPGSVGEQAVGNVAHMVTSIASGALYGALKPARMPTVPAGLAFGGVFFAVAYGLLGPRARLTVPLRRETTGNNVQHLLIHALFGVVTAVAAERLARRVD